MPTPTALPDPELAEPVPRVVVRQYGYVLLYAATGLAMLAASAWRFAAEWELPNGPGVLSGYLLAGGSMGLAFAYLAVRQSVRTARHLRDDPAVATLVRVLGVVVPRDDPPTSFAALRLGAAIASGSWFGARRSRPPNQQIEWSEPAGPEGAPAHRKRILSARDVRALAAGDVAPGAAFYATRLLGPARQAAWYRLLRGARLAAANDPAARSEAPRATAGAAAFVRYDEAGPRPSTRPAR